MPVEALPLLDRPAPLRRCPRCGARPFKPFLRGQIQSTWRRWLRMRYCLLICSFCKAGAGWEKP